MSIRHAILATSGLVLLVACTSSSSTSSGSPPAPAHVADLGKPCLRSTDCASGHCVSKVDDADITEQRPGVCTEACAATSTCLAGWSCLASATGVDLCRCFGTGGNAEVCDGKDNDCDGKIDEEESGEGCCQAPHIACATVCVDPRTDRTNCGGCGRACVGACVDGACTCAAATPTLCPDTCADLTKDPKNCGACGVVCGDGRRCVAGTCRCGSDGSGEACPVKDPISGGPGTTGVCGDDWRCHAMRAYPNPPLTRQLHDAVLGDGEIFLGATQGNAIVSTNVHRTDTATGAQSLIYADGGGALAANGHDLAWVSTTKLFGCPNAICNSSSLATAKAPLAVFGGAAFWLEPQSVARCALTGCGGAPEVFGSDGALGALRGLRVDASGAYFLEGDVIHRIATSGGTVETLGTVPGASALVLDVDTVYVTTASGISSCAKTGCSGGPTSVLAQAGITSLFVDATMLHWSDGTGISTCLRPGCSSPTRILTERTPFGMDAKHYYFVSDKLLYRVTK